MYNSREEMIESAKHFTKRHGYDLVIGHSTKKHGEFARCWLMCELGGEYRNRHHLQPGDRKRKRESRKTNCPFKLLGSRKRHETQWLLSVKDGRHNHDVISKPGEEEIVDSDFPDLEDALYRWHREALLQNNDAAVHGNTLKAKALEFWHTMPQYQNLEPPDFGGDWVKAYRRRHGFPIKMVTKTQHKTSTPSNLTMSSVNAQRLMDATQTPTPTPVVDPALGNDTNAGSDFRLPPSATRLIHALPAANQSLINSIASHVATEMRYNDASHDFLHVLRVLSLSLHILASESSPPSSTISNYDPTSIILAALLHDIADRKYIPPSATASAENVIAATLLDHGSSDALALKVQMIARNVSFSAEQANPRMNRAVVGQHPELAVVQDADRLEAIGAVGIGRTFTYGGAKTGAVGHAGRGLQDTLVHFGEKLERVEALMKTDTGRRLARERTERLAVFKQWWQEETALAST
ncbi:hypothetical protein EV356DRAFT_510953 [Viridothelium virens]|uniref:HTH CENPB-type domain-containing protein n=1 Tax=Viridothelium virens TaxID=1048519 RepID=A0A6A6GV55_VIRVR|nr:hypothetical protein EV356DRAFT_510953 [Viridothelium virens]